MLKNTWKKLCAKNFKTICLVAAFILYGAFSSPTPDHLSWAEIVIGFCLFCAVGGRRVVAVFAGAGLFAPPPKNFLTGLFLILLLPAAMMGVWGGHTGNDMLRDIIPLVFFFLPLFLYGRDVRDELVIGLVCVGVLFALRFWPASGLTLERFGLHRGNDEMLYLTSSPAVLFAGLYLLFQSTRVDAMSIGARVVLAVLSVVCLLTIAATLQRGAIALAAISIFSVFFTRAIRQPIFLTVALALMIGVGAWAGTTMLDIIALVWRKTVEVGDNARLAEWHSVLDALGGDPMIWIFGRGWGAKIMTAASGYADVRYTHMLFSYVLLKAGIVGLLAVLAYVGWLVRRLWRLVETAPILAASLVPSFVLGILLYPSFKMLCFGAMLALASGTLPAHSQQRQDA